MKNNYIGKNTATFLLLKIKDLLANGYVSKGEIDLSEYAKTTDIDTAISNLVNGAPEALDTLKELADAFDGNDDKINEILIELGKKINTDDLPEMTSAELDEIWNTVFV